MTPDKLEQNLDQLGRKLSPGSSLVSAIMARVEGLPMQPARPIQLRRWIMRISIGLAACAAIVYLLATPFGHPPAAWADVLDKVERAKTLSFDWHGPNNMQMHMDCKGELIRVEIESLQIIDIWNRSTGKMLSLERKRNVATTMVVARQPFDFYTWLKDFRDGMQEQTGEQEFDGQKFNTFKITRTAPFANQRTDPISVALWVDPATELPVQAKFNVDGHDVIFENLKFDSPISDDLFSTAIPEGYKIVDLGGIASDKLKPAPTTQEADNLLTLKPGIGIGSLKFGDSMEKVVKALGPPETTRTKSDLGYPSKGLFLFVDSRIGLAGVMAMTKKSSGPFAMNDFAGKTDKGIAMGETQADIEAAYGKATRITRPNDVTLRLEYQKLGLTFRLDKDELVEIYLFMIGR